MDNKIATQNQQLTVKQQALLNKIAKTGNLPEVAFAKNVIEFSKLRDLEANDISQGLSMLFTKIANLIGIKDPISNINKADIKEMILMRFKGLSLEEIDYYFKLERYGVYDDKTEHFQLFNAEYVSTVLNKGKNWLQKTRFDNNIPIAKIEKPKDELSEEDKELMVINGVMQCFEDFKITRSIEPGKSYVFDYLYKKGVLPKHTKQFIKKTKRKAARNIYNKKQSNPRDFKDLLKLVVQGENKMKTECKHIVMKTYFIKLIRTNKTLTQDLIDKR